MIALVAVCASACAPTELQILSKDGPPASVGINGAEAIRAPCNGGVVLRPGELGVPPLRIQRDSAGVSASFIVGPVVPSAGPSV